MIKNRVSFLFIVAFTSLPMYAMDITSEKRTIEKNWLVLYKNSRNKWTAFNKTKAGLWCEAARIMHKRYNCPRTSFLMKRTLKKANKTSEFNDYTKAKKREMLVRKALGDYDLKNSQIVTIVK